MTALIEYLDRFNAVQDERQSVVKGLLVKWVLVDCSCMPLTGPSREIRGPREKS